MRYSALATVLIGLSALCWTACSTTRSVSAVKSEEWKVKSEVLATTDETDFTDVRDTLQEVTTITIDRNDKGDTLRIATVTDRTRARSRNRVSTQETKVEVRVDTVYLERRDSVLVQDSRFTVHGDQSERTALHTTLKWIFWIIIGLIGLTITVKVCSRKR